MSALSAESIFTGPHETRHPPVRGRKPFAMTLSIWGQQLAAFVVYFLYESFFEWVFHKHLFHSPKFIKKTFKAHQLIHHQRYKFDHSSYEWQEGQEKDHIAMDWFALPLFVAVHLPIFALIQYVTGWQSLWGGVASVVAYYGVYEYFHFCMHVPAGRWFEKIRPYTFAKEHHRIHHKYMQQNLNVFFPLADLCLGTFRSAKSLQTPAQTSPSAVNTSTTARVEPLSRRETAQAVGKE